MKSVLLMVRKLHKGGGTETYVFTLATTLQQSGHRVGIYTSGGPWVSYFRKHGLTVHVVPQFQSSKEQLIQLIRKRNYQNVHTQDGYSISLVAKLVQRPFRIIATIHGKYIEPDVVRKASRISSLIIAVSPVVYQYALNCGVPYSKLKFIANGVSPTLFRHDRSLSKFHRNEFVIGYAARFTLEKILLGRRIAHILKSYQQKNPHVRVLIAGRGSKLHLIENHRFNVLGQVDQMTRFYNSCDVVIGTGRVALEAMACGIPVIAVGFNHYIGLLTPGNIDIAWRSNFGDHGNRRIYWQPSRLHSDLNRVRMMSMHERASRAMQMRQRVLKQFSAEVMVRSILLSYK